MVLRVAILNERDKPTQYVDVPALLLPDGRADLKAIRRHLREHGLPSQRIRVVPPGTETALAEPTVILLA